MPDISMCDGDGCPLRDTCYRFTASPNELWQPYFSVAPYNPEDDSCSHYWQVTP